VEKGPQGRIKKESRLNTLLKKRNISLKKKIEGLGPVTDGNT